MPSKMYILVREKMIKEHFGLAVTSVAHAGAAAILEWWSYPELINNPDKVMEDWLNTSFRKVICKVSEEQFDQAMKDFGPCKESYLLMIESAINNENMCLVFRPREEWPTFFKYLSLWK